MLMADGVLPSNEGRGYVLRRIIRRALRYARRLEVEGPVLTPLVEVVLRPFAGIHFDAKELDGVVRRVQRDLEPEEERFGKTLSLGIDRVGEEIERLRRSGEKVLPGSTVFRLYDTYGIPIDLVSVEEIAADEGLSIDRSSFETALDEQRARSRGAAKFAAADASVFEKLDLPEEHSEFRGYPELDFCSLSGARVLALVHEGRPVRSLSAGESGEAITDRTVFYPEGGGQVADQGKWPWPGAGREVTDVQKPVPGLIAHRVTVDSGTSRSGRRWTWRSRNGRAAARRPTTPAPICSTPRCGARCSESARQMGSLVAPDRLRFDYAASAAPSPAEIAEIERLVNEEILRDREVTKEHMTMEESRARGAIAFFGEKYGERVRVVDVPGFSTELCGGCHVPRTGEIGAFKIVSDRGLAAGVRRLEAVTSLGAVELLRHDEETLNALSSAAQVARAELVSRWQEREERVKALEREIASLKLSSPPETAGARDEVGRGRRADRHEACPRAFDSGAAQSLRRAALEVKERRRRRRDGSGGEDLGRGRGHRGPRGTRPRFRDRGAGRQGPRRKRRRQGGSRSGRRPGRSPPAGRLEGRRKSSCEPSWSPKPLSKKDFKRERQTEIRESSCRFGPPAS